MWEPSIFMGTSTFRKRTACWSHSHLMVLYGRQAWGAEATPPASGGGVAVDGEVGVPVGEVEVLAVDFDFAALEVGGFGAEAWFGGLDGGAVVAVDDEAVGVDVAAVEVADAV